MANKLIEIYQQKHDQYCDQLKGINKIVRTISLVRLFVFLLTIFLIYYTSQIDLFILLAVSIIGFSIFLYLIKMHQKYFNKRKLIEELVKINKNEIEALNYNLENFNKGEEYIDPEHNYTNDLDVFGQGSVYQYINRCSTRLGMNMLAHWFYNPLKCKEKITERQHGIDDLKDKLEWRQNFQANGNLINEKEESLAKVNEWMAEKDLYRGKKIYSFFIYAIPVLNFSLLFLLIYGLIPESFFVLSFVISLSIAGKNFRKNNSIHEKVSRTSNTLSVYATLIKSFEDSDCKTSHLQSLKQKLVHNNKNASRNIAGFARIINSLDYRLNFIMGFLLNWFFWDVRQIRRLEIWRNEFKNELPKWIDVISEIEALSSLGSFAYNNPDFNFPLIKTDDFILKAEDAGHPLLAYENRVDNEICIDGWKNFMIITGANMAGKSTYLRTVGVNLLLAMTGSVVCAKKFEFYPLDILTSIRTKDSLQKNESYFYAELKRLKHIIDELQSGSEVLIILDEILKGTNSKDKQEGSKALLKQLISLNAVGFIATHDLSLGDLQNLYPENIKNKCFEVDIENDQLSFDYKLKDGLAQNMNATFLMKKMGITV